MSRCRCCLLGISCWVSMIYIAVDLRYWGLAWSSWAALQLTTPSLRIFWWRHFCMKKTQEMPAQSYRLGHGGTYPISRFVFKCSFSWLNCFSAGDVYHGISKNEKRRVTFATDSWQLWHLDINKPYEILWVSRCFVILWASELAQEILTQPAVLYCDEPTTGLETEQQFSSWLFGEFPGVTWSDLKTLRIALWQRLRSQCLMCAFRHFLGKKMPGDCEVHEGAVQIWA